MENLQNDLGVNNYYFEIFKELSEDLNLRLRGAKRASLGLEDGYNDLEKIILCSTGHRSL